MDFNEYQELSKRTMPNTSDIPNRNQARSNYALGLNCEAGELGDHVKKYVYHGHNLSRFDFVEEAGDVLHYLSGICALFEVNLEDVAKENIKKLIRRYPDGFSHEASRNRKD